MAVNVKFTNRTKQAARALEKESQKAFIDVVNDIKRVSSDAAPFKTGVLERNRLDTTIGKDSMKGTISFEAFNRGFNYAIWTHNENYNLGEGSLKKRGGSSKFGSGTVPVGTGYLENTVEYFRDDYINHLETTIKETVSRYNK